MLWTKFCIEIWGINWFAGLTGRSTRIQFAWTWNEVYSQMKSRKNNRFWLTTKRFFLRGIIFFLILCFIKLKLIFKCWELKIKSQNQNCDIFPVLRLFCLKQLTWKTKAKINKENPTKIKTTTTNQQTKPTNKQTYLNYCYSGKIFWPEMLYPSLHLISFHSASLFQYRVGTCWNAELSAYSVKLCKRTSQHRRQKELWCLVFS